MQIEVILAVATNGVVGNCNQLPWSLRDDLAYFRKITTGQAIVMGRKTFESIGRPLPNRCNLILSKSSRVIEGATLLGSLHEATAFCEEAGIERLIVIGGPSLWDEVRNSVEVVHLTRVSATPIGDTRYAIPIEWYSWDYEKVHQGEQNERNDHAFVTWRIQRPDRGKNDTDTC